ncbi:MAG TPA: hypothetical protein VGP42_16505 [Stellaceae bacterium]|jgi:hypothetical protein|nr:hypothetical protein [Stellaceae bacterium]
MAKSIAREVEKNGESWRSKSGPVKKQIEREFPRGQGQRDDHGVSGGYLQRKSGSDDR